MKALQQLRAAGKNALSGGIAALLLLTAGAASSVKAVNPYPDSSYLYRQYNNAMNYRLFVPPTYNPNGTDKHPLVIFFHGNGQFDNGFVAGNPNVCNSAQMGDLGQYAFVTTANQAIFPCFFVLVQKTNPGTMTLPNATAGMIDQLATQYRIDPDRVVVTGLSGGGAEVFEMAQFHTNKVAAVVGVCSVVPPVVPFDLPNGPVPAAWFFHGSDDGQVGPYSAFICSRKFSEKGGSPIFTMYNTSNHGIWGTAYSTPQLIPWLAAQRRGLPSQNDPASVTFSSPATNPATVGTPNITVSGGSTQLSGLNAQLTSARYVKGQFIYSWNYIVANGTPTSWSTNSIALNAAGTNTKIEVALLGSNVFTSNYTGTTYYSKVLDVTYQTGGADTTAPAVAITAPTSNATYTQSAATINLGGTASDNVGVTQVTWTNDRGGSGTATGTTSWSANGVALLSGVNVLTVTARDAANNTSTDTLTVTYQPADTTAPTVTITAPTSNTTLTQTATTVSLGGTASDNVGVTQVTWANDRGGSGTAAGTTSWSVNNVALLSGVNVLTVTARDAANNTSTDTLTVTVNTTPPPSTGWTGVNIDSTGGSYSENAGAFSITGTGEVWGAKSGMYYVYKPADGDCSITTKITSTQNTNWGYGKGGVMIRDGLTAANKHVFMAMMYNNGSVLYSSNAGDSTTHGGGVAPYWLRLTRVGNLFTGSIAPDVSGAPGTWTVVGTRTMVMGSAVYVGMGSTSNDTTYNTSTFTNTTTTGTPEEWQTLDIGTTGGSASVSGDVFTVAGKGVLWGGSDKVRYVYQNASGDCSITARVLTVGNTNWGYGRAGVMIRETTSTGSPYVYHGITGSVGAALHSSNAGASVTYASGITAPYWVRLTRSGSLFTAEIAPNVSNAPGAWTTVGTRTMTMGTNVFIGLGVFSNDDAVLNTSTLDGVSVTP